jgi:hypothetical protein
MYSLCVGSDTGRLDEIDTHDTCEGAVEFMLAVWCEDTVRPAFACVLAPSGRVLVILRPTRSPDVVRVLRKGGAVTLHAVKDAPRSVPW